MPPRPSHENATPRQLVACPAVAGVVGPLHIHHGATTPAKCRSRKGSFFFSSNCGGCRRKSWSLQMKMASTVDEHHTTNYSGAPFVEVNEIITHGVRSATISVTRVRLRQPFLRRRARRESNNRVERPRWYCSVGCWKRC